MRVLVATPSPALRMGLRAMLADVQVEVVGETSTLNQFEGPLPPADVLLVADPSLLQDGVAHFDQEGAIAVVLLDDDEGAVATLRSLPLRGWGVVPPDVTGEELAAALTAASHGMVVLPLSTAEGLLNAQPDLEPLPETLTPREQEVLELLSHGLPNKLIARELEISEHTVKFHISAILSKLGASSRTDAVTRGARHGLITL